MILITSTGELLLYFTVILFSFIYKKKKGGGGGGGISCNTVFGVVLCCLISTAGLNVQWV